MDLTRPDIYNPADHKEEWTPEMYTKLDKAQEIIEEWWLPHKRQLDRLGGIRASMEMADVLNGLHKAIIENGFYARTISKANGGPGWSMHECGLMSAEITKMAYSPRLDDAFAYGEPWCHILENWVPDETVKKEYIKRALSGGFCTIWATDPESGVDMGGMRGDAVLKDGQYTLNGPKWWMAMCSPGPMGLQWHLVLMKTDTSKRTSGLSLFLVNDDADGIIRGREGDLMGAGWGCVRYELLFKDLKVDQKYLAAPEGKGLYAIVDAMNKHMGNQAMQAVGVAEASISQAIEYTSSTIRWDNPLIEYQGVHFPIADMWVDAEASRALASKANKLYDAGDPDAKHGKWSILAFRQAATAAIDSCRKTIELMGARSIEREEGWNMELMYRDSLIFNLYRTPNIDRKFLASYLVRKRL